MKPLYLMFTDVVLLTKIFSYTDHFSDGVSAAEVMVLNETKMLRLRRIMTQEEKRSIWIERS